VLEAFGLDQVECCVEDHVAGFDALALS